MSKLSGIRVFGGLVNSEQTYVDYGIVGTDEEGRIHLENTNDASDERVWTNEDVRSAFEEDLAMNGSDIPVPGDKLWDMMDKIGKRRVDGTYNNFATQEIENSQRALFLAAVEEGKDV